jgi:hypothetical protein
VVVVEAEEPGVLISGLTSLVAVVAEAVEVDPP